MIFMMHFNMLTCTGLCAEFTGFEHFARVAATADAKDGPTPTYSERESREEMSAESTEEIDILFQALILGNFPVLFCQNMSSFMSKFRKWRCN